MFPMSPTADFEGAQVRGQACAIEHLFGQAGRQGEFLLHEWQHAGDVGVGLGEGDARLQASDLQVTELADEDLCVIELHRQDEGAGGLFRKRKLAGRTPTESPRGFFH